jgi:PAS domain S-box-containing protein
MKFIGENRTRIILNSIADGVFTVDLDWKITSFNRAAERITGIPEEKALGRFCWEVFSASICEQACALGQTMKTGRPIVNKEIYIVNSKGDRIPVSISTALLLDDDGVAIGGVETFRDLSVEAALKKALSDRCSFGDIISKNKRMTMLFEMIELLSDNDSTVLILGESGVGKELLAKAIHNGGKRASGPMITVNCAAIPDTLLESELFGYKAGAFTDAKKDKPGKFALAKGGTIFLDEIAELSPMLQVRLLRVLQDKSYEPLGSVRSEKADVRILAATNRDLEKMTADGLFRRDLFYRINVVKLELPPLRNRKEDIPLLVEHFVSKFNRLNAKEIRGPSPEVLSTLMNHDYPGNIRELENIVEYASVVCRESLIGMEHLPEYLRPSFEDQKRESETPGAPPAAAEKGIVYEALKQCGWHRGNAARMLGIHPATLWRKIKRLGLDLPDTDGRSRPRRS